MKVQLHPEKDQHLLINSDVIKRIVKEARLSKEDKVIEIGAGTGILTSKLIKNTKKVLVFEIDSQFKQTLDKIKSKNLEVIYNNALNADWRGYNKIISNIPYSLSEPIVIKAIEDKINLMILTVGENFKKILEKKNTKIGILANLFFDITPIIKVNKTDFNPSPRTDSWVIKFERKIKPDNTDKILQEIVLRKGKIKNAIISSLTNEKKTKNQAREIIQKIKIDNHILEKPVKSITGKFLILLRERLKDYFQK